MNIKKQLDFIKNIPVPTIIIDENGTELRFNPSLENLFSSNSEFNNFLNTYIFRLIEKHSSIKDEHEIKSDILYINYVNTNKYFKYNIKKIIFEEKEFFIILFCDISKHKKELAKINDFFYNSILNVKTPLNNTLTQIEELFQGCVEKKCLSLEKFEDIISKTNYIANRIDDLKINYISKFKFNKNNKKVNIKELLSSITGGLKQLNLKNNINFDINICTDCDFNVFIDPDIFKQIIIMIYDFIVLNISKTKRSIVLQLKNNENNIELIIKFPHQNKEEIDFDFSEINSQLLKINGIFSSSYKDNMQLFFIKFPAQIKEVTKSIKIAVVEDEQDILELYKAIFADNEEFSVEYFSSGKSFIDSNEFFHVLILDLFMPDISGFDVMDVYTKDNKETKIVIVSGAPPSTLDENINSQIVKILSKPIDIFALMAVVKDCINRIKEEREE